MPIRFSFGFSSVFWKKPDAPASPAAFAGVRVTVLPLTLTLAAVAAAGRPRLSVRLGLGRRASDWICGGGVPALRRFSLIPCVAVSCHCPAPPV